MTSTTPSTDDRPTTLLQALCKAAGVQGGTIHQYDLSRLRWVCYRKPNTRRNTEGIYILVYTDPDGAEWDIGYTGGPSISIVRGWHAINPSMSCRWNRHPEPLNRQAWKTIRQRGGEA